MKIMKAKKNIFLKVIKLIKTLDGKILWLLFLRSLITAIIPFAPVVIMGYVIDKLDKGEDSKKVIIFAVIGVILILIISLFKSFIHRECQVKKQVCVKKYDTLIAEHTINMDYSFLESEKLQELRSRIAEDNNWGYGLSGMITLIENIMQRVISLFVAVIIVVPIINNNKVLISGSLAFLVLLVSMLIALIKVRKKSYDRQMKAMESIGTTNRLINSFTNDISYKSGKDIRIYKSQSLINQKGAETYFQVKKQISKNVGKVMGKSDGFSGFVIGICEGLSFLMVAVEALKKTVTIGQVITFSGAINQFASSLSYLIVNINELSVHTQRFISTFEYLEIPVTTCTERKSIGDNEKHLIEFKDVCFNYPGNKEFSLEHINLVIKSGEHLAVVGKNGSGKSTMIKLLCRLYVPTKGQILLDGVDINEIEISEYIDLLSVVFQDFSLFAFSIKDNICAGSKAYNDRIIQSIEKAGFSKRLTKMEDGIDTPIYNELYENGIEISGGEAQKIVIARALYKNSPIMVLDEPTSALDPFAEAEIYQKFSKISEGKTTIFISHRLSSCRFCDTIVVFEKGKIVELGTHKELVSKLDGKYSELWKAQEQYYN